MMTAHLATMQTMMDVTMQRMPALPPAPGATMRSRRNASVH
jgi:hypothetical protein